MSDSHQIINNTTISELETLIENVVCRVLKQSGITVNGGQKTELNSYHDKLTPTERKQRFLDWVATIPQSNTILPDEALHRDSMY
jgi:hypothetical protein